MNFNFTTGISAEEAKAKTIALVNAIKAPTMVSGVESSVNLNESMPKVVEDPYPVICLINGSAACGKGTLISLIKQYCQKPVYELSSIDPIRPVAKMLMEYSGDFFNDIAEPGSENSTEEQEEIKAGAYRQFMAELKQTWIRYNDGPSTYVVGSILRLILEQNSTVDEHGFVIESEAETAVPAFIFVNIREPDEIIKTRDALFSRGLLCFTMLVDGLAIPTTGGAENDYHVNEFNYDITIRNKGTVDDLSITAFTMNTFLGRANQMYGISISGSSSVINVSDPSKLRPEFQAKITKPESVIVPAEEPAPTPIENGGTASAPDNFPGHADNTQDSGTDTNGAECTDNADTTADSTIGNTGETVTEESPVQESNT